MGTGFESTPGPTDRCKQASTHTSKQTSKQREEEKKEEEGEGKREGEREGDENKELKPFWLKSTAVSRRVPSIHSIMAPKQKAGVLVEAKRLARAAARAELGARSHRRCGVAPDAAWLQQTGALPPWDRPLS